MAKTTTRTRSSADTKKLASQLAKKTASSKAIKTAKVIGLIGDLGSGKTTFSQGFIQALGVRQRIVSPTFLIFRAYPLKSKKYKKVYHVDLYRVHKWQDLVSLGFKKILVDPKNIVLVEWADKIRRYLPSGTIWIHFEHGLKLNERNIVIEAEPRG